MPRKKAPKNEYRQSKVLADKESVKPVSLSLPEAHPKQYELITAFDRMPGVRFVVGAMGTKFGKCLSINELIPTPSGWKRMLDIQAGDYVFDEQGRPVLVTYATDPMYGKRCYEVVFSDDSVIVTDEDHLWVTETHACRKNRARSRNTSYTPQIISTKQIKDSLIVDMGGKERPNHSIPVVSGPLQYPKADLTLDPYILGYWMGNGGTSSYVLSTIDQEVVEEFKRNGFEVTPVSHKDWQVKGIRPPLREIGVWDNKHIPSTYLMASAEQRLSLLQGLMDSDGTVCKKGHVCFDNTNESLVNAVAELAVSLGIKVNRGGRVGKLYGVEKKYCYRVWFTTDIPVFRVSRKMNRVRTTAAKAKRRYIVDVRETTSQPVKCIRVASDTHLFLAGKSCIPTHNSFGCSFALVRQAWNNKNTLNWWVAPTYAQSKMAYSLVKNLLPKDTYVEQKADLRLILLEPDNSHRSVIEFKSGENADNLRGFGVHFFILDEAARVSEEAFTSLLTTTTNTFGKGIIISTPKGRNWFYYCYQKGVKFDEATGEPLYTKENDPHPEWFSMRMPTWENPTNRPEAIEEMRRNLPEDVFQQEVAAHFLSDSAGVFRGVSKCITGELQGPQVRHSYVMGVDLARSRDYTVITVMDRDQRHVVYHERFTQVAWSVQYHKIIDIARRYKAQCCIDATGLGDPVAETIAEAGIAVLPYSITGSRAKQLIIDKLRLNIEQGSITFPPIPVLKKELEMYEFEVTDSGVVKYSAPPGQHDDCVISLALANHLLEQPIWRYRYSSRRGI